MSRAPPNAGPLHITKYRIRQQEKLRTACKMGDLSEVADALEPKPNLWWQYATRLFAFLSSSKGEQDQSSREPAHLGWVYKDDAGNMPIHYIALGGKPMMCSSLLAMLCMKPADERCNDARHAELLRWLLDNHPDIDLSAVNARRQTPAHCAIKSGSLEVLETPAHCAIQLRSLEVLEVLLTHQPAIGAPRQVANILTRDQEDRRPLDAALMTQQWPAVRLLIAAGALQACPELGDAQWILQNRMSRDQLGTYWQMVRGPVRALGKAAVHLWRQGTGLGEESPASISGSLDWEGQDISDAQSSVMVLESPQQIYQHRQASIQQLADTLAIGAYAAEWLMEACQWDAAAAAEQGLKADHRLANGASRLHLDSQSDMADELSQSRLQPCSVCFEETPAFTPSKPPCKHHTCEDCLRGILLASMEDGDLGRCVCPVPDCGSRIPAAAQELLGIEQLERYQLLAAHSYANQSIMLQWCPKPGCARCVALEEGFNSSRAAVLRAGRALDVRCSCGEAFCLCCGGAPHEPAPCAAVRDWNAMLREAQKLAASQSESWVTRNTKACPGCRAPIQKNGGCNHVTCTRCRGQFCWVCGRDWNEHSSETGGYYSCNRSAQADLDGPAAVGIFGIRSYISSLCGRVQVVAERHRLEHFLKCYYAQSCDERSLRLAADWMAALLSSGVPATGLQQPLQQVSVGLDAQASTTETHAEGEYAYLSQVVGTVSSARRVLANSYIAAYGMPWTERKGQFQRIQEHLESLVLQCTSPLAHLPQMPAVSEAAEQQVRAAGGEALLECSLNRLPLEIADGHVIQRQFYHALAVHSLGIQLKSLMADVDREKSRLLLMARNGL